MPVPLSPLDQQRRRPADADLAGQRHHLLDRPARAHEAAEVIGVQVLLPEELHLLPELPRLEGVAQGHAEVLEVDGLGDVVVGAEPHRLHRRADIGVGGHDDHLDVGMALLDLAEHLDPVRVGQLEIQQEEVGALLPDGRHGSRAVLRGLDVVAELLERLLEGPANQALVVNDQHSGWHRCRSSLRRSAGSRAVQW